MFETTEKGQGEIEWKLQFPHLVCQKCFDWYDTCVQCGCHICIECGKRNGVAEAVAQQMCPQCFNKNADQVERMREGLETYQKAEANRKQLIAQLEAEAEVLQDLAIEEDDVDVSLQLWDEANRKQELAERLRKVQKATPEQLAAAGLNAEQIGQIWTWETPFLG